VRSIWTNREATLRAGFAGGRSAVFGEEGEQFVNADTDAQRSELSGQSL
jgi:hypothetical protein